MGEWRAVTIEGIARKIAMGPFGSNIKVETFVPKGVPIISGQHLHGTRLDERDGYNFITEEHAEKLKNSNVFPGDIVFTHAGTIGQVALIPKNTNYDRYVISQRQFYLRVDTSKADPAFIARWFHSPLGKHRLLMHASQVGVPSISRPASNLKGIKIELPPLSEQKAISRVFDAIDDKIELNRRTNETLEATARAIFKDWFVDFGPTRAKAEGRDPYLAPEIWELFPDALDNEDMPAGWETTSLGQLIEFNPKEALKKGVVTPYLEMGALPTSGAIPEAPVPRAFTSGMRFRNGDTLFARITPCLENGKTCFVQQLKPDEIGWGSTEFIVMRSRPPAPAGFSYLVARDHAFRTRATQSMTGTSGRQRARTELLESFLFCRPDEPVWAAFTSNINPIFQKIAANGEGSRTLAQTRDLLLPKLMSGEIRLRDAEKAVEAVA